MTASGLSLPVTVLTGFLGSGKTTVLAGLLKQPEMAGTGVLINEFGEVGLDHLLVDAPDAKPVLLQNGCLCCTVRGDLALALQDIFLRRTLGDYAIRRVIIETTGLADPAPIVHTLMTDPGICGHFRLEGIVTVVDCVNGCGTLDRHPEAAKQAAIADRLLLTKQDIAAAADVSRLRARLFGLNAGAVVIDAPQGKLAPAHILRLSLFDPQTRGMDVQKWLRAEAYPKVHDHDCCDNADCDHESHHPHHRAPHEPHSCGIRSRCLVRARPVAWNDFSAWLQGLIDRRSAELLRVKGIVNIQECPDEPLVIHGVQHVFHPPVRIPAWPSEDRRTRIVLISRDWDEADIASEFARIP